MASLPSCSCFSSLLPYASKIPDSHGLPAGLQGLLFSISPCLPLLTSSSLGWLISFHTGASWETQNHMALAYLS